MQQATSVQSNSTSSPTSGASSPNGMPPGSAGVGGAMAQQQQQMAGGISPATQGATGTATSTKTHVNGGRFDFDDGGTYCGGWEDGKAHGHGVCTGPKGQGAYSGSWHYGFEVSGIYTWPSGSSYEGQWQNGKRHGLGVEARGRWTYRGEWTQGFKGRYGVRQSSTSNAKYEGTWANGLQDGYGSETYADGGTYQGQWLRGMRHGFGVRTSAPFGMASHYRPNKSIRASLTSLRSNDQAGGSTVAIPDATERRDRRIDDSRGGFVLKAKSDETPVRRNSLVEKTKRGLLSKLRKQRSTGDLEKKGSGSIRSTGSSASWMTTDSSKSELTNASVHTDSNASFVVEDEQLDVNVTETYMGEWKNDKRTGVGISERSDGLRYEGEWFANKKYGYGVTTFRDGSKEEGKYKNNVLITSQKKKHIFLIRSAKFRERIDAAVNAAQRASKIALQKADIAISRTATARGKAELADIAAEHAKEDSDIAQLTAKQFAPDFKPPGIERIRPRDQKKFVPPPENALPGKSILQNPIKTEQPIQNQINQPSPLYNQYNSVKEPPDQQINTSPYQSPTLPNSYSPYQQQQSLTNYVSPTTQTQYSQQMNYNKNQQMPTYNQSYQNSMQSNQQQYQQSIDAQKASEQIMMANQTDQQNRIPNAVQSQMLNQQQQQQQQQQFTNQMMDNSHYQQQIPSSNQQDIMPTMRSNTKPSAMKPSLEALHSQTSVDRFDHYNRPPSRDSSVDRYTRATGRLSAQGSRQPSVDKSVLTQPEMPDRSSRAPSVIRGGTPVPSNMPQTITGNGSIKTGIGANTPLYNVPMANQKPLNKPFEEIILTKRNLGQDIIPSPFQPKRTESLYVTPGRPAPPPKAIPVAATTLQRKKSLPDVQALPKATMPMPREEVSALGSARREEIRRQLEESERLRANPLLYLVSPPVKDWFSRQQLTLLVLFVNISLAIMFFKLLT